MSWIQFYPKRPDANLRLICFPFAGGSSSIYRTFSKFLQNQVEILAVVYPGREARMRDPLPDSLKSLAESFIKANIGLLKEKPYVFYGHSLGSMAAYEAILCIMRFNSSIASESERIPLPLQFIPAASSGPAVRRGIQPGDKIIRNLNLQEMRTLLKEYGATPVEILENDSHLSFFLPPVQRDLAIGQEYVTDPNDSKIPCPITYICGSDDKISPESQQIWSGAGDDFELLTIKAGHFFVLTHTEELCGLIKGKLARFFQ